MRASSGRRLPLMLLITALAGFSFSRCERISPDKARARDPREIFGRANSLYEAGKYKEALGEYEKLIGAGYVSGNLYYNMGNAFFKLDQKGKAILFYRRALSMMPRDQDVRSNLDYAASLIQDRIEPPPRPWALRLWESGTRHFTAGEMRAAALCLYWILCLAAIPAICSRSLRPVLSRVIIVLLLCLFVAVSAIISRVYFERRDEAVILCSEAKVRYGPSNEDVVAFVLHEGAVVRIENVRGDWCQVSLPDGKAGWLGRDCCGTI